MKADQSPNAEGQISGENQSLEAFIASRLEDQTAEEAETEETEETESEDEIEETESEDADGTDESEVEESEESEEEESEGGQGEEIDLLELEPEQIQELAKKAKSRLLKDVGKLRAENRMLEERLANLESQGQKQTKQEDSFSDIKLPPAIESLSSFEEIEAKEKEFRGTQKIVSDILRKHKDYSDEAEVLVGDKYYTIGDLKTAQQNAIDGLVEYLPIKRKKLEKYERLTEGEKLYRAHAEKEVPEIADEKSDIGKNYRILVNDPLIKQVKEKLPELGFQMEYILAHAARSIFGKSSKVPQGAGSKLKAKLPASPVSSATVSRTTGNKSKVEAAKARYEKTGSQADWNAYRMAQMGQ